MRNTLKKIAHSAAIGLLLAGGLLLLAACGPGPSEHPANVPQGDTAVVIDVIDGDTIEVSLAGEQQRLRYIGVDTPERDEPFYKEAAAANRRLVDGQTVVLVRDVSETDRFGRLLRYVYLSDGTFVNAELLRQGMARLVTFPPDVAQQAHFADLQRQAREARAGLWAESELLNEPGAVCDCRGNQYNCRDFETQQAAQACYDACLASTGVDIHHLDGGGDGRVCEALP